MVSPALCWVGCTHSMRKHISDLNLAILGFCTTIAVMACFVPQVNLPEQFIKTGEMTQEIAYHQAVVATRDSGAAKAMIAQSASDYSQTITQADDSIELRNTVPEEETTEQTTATPVAEQTEQSASELSAAETTPPGAASTPLWTTDDVSVLCKTVFGEAGTESPEQMAAVVWCVLNRVDDPTFPDNISDVATQAFQFQGYNRRNPIDLTAEKIALDVLERWQREKNGEMDVGHILPREYLYFLGDGIVNHYTKSFGAAEEWDWSLESPYTSGQTNERSQPNG